MKRQAVWVYGGGQRVAGNLIVLWSGSLETIPAGGYLCDGQNGTPDLRDHFVVGTTYEYAAGADRHVGDETNQGTLSHLHSFTLADESTHVHPLPASTTEHYQVGGVGTTGDIGGSLEYLGAHEHGLSGTTLSGTAHNHRGSANSDSNATVDLRPPWYALAYVMVQGDVPVGAMALAWVVGDPYGWVYDPLLGWQSVSPLPAGYILCDGGGGTPDMSNSYVIGVTTGLDLGGGYGAEYGRFQIADHLHGDGSITVAAESAHVHKIGSVYSDYTAFSLVTAWVKAAFGDPTAMSSMSMHLHALWLEDHLTGTSTHTHAFLGLNAGANTSLVADSALPRSVALHWVMRVS